MTIAKVEVHNAAVSVTVTNVAEGKIPDNLAKITATVLALHKANGDLLWVSDMVSDILKGDA